MYCKLFLQVSFNICGSIWNVETAFKYLNFAENFKNKSFHGLDKILYVIMIIIIILVVPWAGKSCFQLAGIISLRFY